MKDSLAPERAQKGGGLRRFDKSPKWRTWLDSALLNLDQYYLAPLGGLSRGAIESSQELGSYLTTLFKNDRLTANEEVTAVVRALAVGAMQEAAAAGGEGGGGTERPQTPLPLDFVVGCLADLYTIDPETQNQHAVLQLIREVYERIIAPVLKSIVAR